MCNIHNHKCLQQKTKKTKKKTKKKKKKFGFNLAFMFTVIFSLCQLLSILYRNVGAHERIDLGFENLCVHDISKNIILWQRCLQRKTNICF